MRKKFIPILSFLCIAVLAASCSNSSNHNPKAQIVQKNAPSAQQTSPNKAKIEKLDPTGTYKHKTDGGKNSAGDPGVIQVKSIGKNKIILNLYVSRGAPSFNSGSAFDTLTYRSNHASYKLPELNPTCNITFDFSVEGVQVNENDNNNGCGFGHGVIAGGFFQKTSSREPVFMNYATGKKIE